VSSKHQVTIPTDALRAAGLAVGADRLITTDRGWPTRRQLGIRAAIVVL
jgi:hypothetical protein